MQFWAAQCCPPPFKSPCSSCLHRTRCVYGALWVRKVTRVTWRHENHPPHAFTTISGLNFTLFSKHGQWSPGKVVNAFFYCENDSYDRAKQLPIVHTSVHGGKTFSVDCPVELLVLFTSSGVDMVTPLGERKSETGELGNKQWVQGLWLNRMGLGSNTEAWT